MKLTVRNLNKAAAGAKIEARVANELYIAALRYKADDAEMMARFDIYTHRYRAAQKLKNAAAFRKSLPDNCQDGRAIAALNNLLGDARYEMERADAIEQSLRDKLPTLEEIFTEMDALGIAA